MQWGEEHATGTGPADWFSEPHGSAGAGKGELLQRGVEPELLTRADVFVIWERKVNYVKGYM